MGRRGLVLLALVASTILVLAAVSAFVTRPGPPLGRGGVGAPIPIDGFMIGLGCVESDGDYEARNERTRAIGKYQILPRNWRVWGERYLDDPDAEPTPQNQETVALRRLNGLHRSLDRNWARVAYWWLTGNDDPDKSTWTDFALGYVTQVLTYARLSQTMEGRAHIPLACFSTPDEPFPSARPTLRVARSG